MAVSFAKSPQESGASLAQFVELAALDIGVLSLNPTLDAEIT